MSFQGELNDYTFLRHTRINDHTYIVRESFGYDQNLPNSYFFIGVVIGEKEVAVIDSGNGVTCGLRRYIEEKITGKDKPMICLLTHNHLDHVGASMMFDRRYMHEDDIDEESLAWSNNLDRLLMSDDSDLAQFCQHDPDVLAYCRKNYYRTRAKAADFIPVKDGDEIDIGGITFRVYHMPGHSRGSCTYFDMQDHIAFSGDAIAAGGMGLSNVQVDGESETLHYLKRAKAEWPEDSLICGGHHMIYGMDLIDKLLAGYEEIAQGINVSRDTIAGPPPFKYTKGGPKKRTPQPGAFGMTHYHDDISMSYRVKPL